MEREQTELAMVGLDRPGTVIRYGHLGRPVIVFPSEQGRAWDYENNGMVDALRPLIDEGRVKLYCVDSFDHLSWSDRGAPLEHRARRHEDYERWLVERVVPLIRSDSPGYDADGRGIVATGCSLGAFHALSMALRHGDLVDRALCLSGSYDPSAWHAWGDRGDAAYFTNPTDYVRNLEGGHLEWLRSRLRLVLVVRAGTVGGAPHRVAAVHARDGRAAAREGDLVRARRVGPRLGPRLAVVAAAGRSPPAAPALIPVGSSHG